MFLPHPNLSLLSTPFYFFGVFPRLWLFIFSRHPGLLMTRLCFPSFDTQFSESVRYTFLLALPGISCETAFSALLFERRFSPLFRISLPFRKGIAVLPFLRVSPFPQRA